MLSPSSSQLTQHGSASQLTQHGSSRSVKARVKSQLLQTNHHGGRLHLKSIFGHLASGLRNPLFNRPFVIAFLCASCSLGVKVAADYGYTPWFEHESRGGEKSIRMDGAVWSSMTFALGFLLVLRAQQAHGRYWQGFTAVNLMRAEWYDAGSALIAMCSVSEKEASQVDQVKHILVRLLSLFHTSALVKLMDKDMAHAEVRELELIDPAFDDATLQTFESCPHKVELVMQWIQVLAMSGNKDGIIAAPAPIVSRCFQELSNGMVRYHEALEVKAIQFPAAHVELCFGLLAVHWLLTPVVLAMWINSKTLATMISFVTVFVFWTIIAVAEHIEKPFSTSLFIHEATLMQAEFNSMLCNLLSPEIMRMPGLKESACKGPREGDTIAMTPLMNLWNQSSTSATQGLSGHTSDARLPRSHSSMSTTSSFQMASSQAPEWRLLMKQPGTQANPITSSAPSGVVCTEPDIPENVFTV